MAAGRAFCGAPRDAAGDDRQRLVLGNTLEAVESGRQQLLPFFERHALHSMVVNRIEVVFEELVSNIVRHGFSPGSQQSIHVCIAALPGAVALVLEDDGVPFDPFHVPQPAAFTSLQSAPLGGLGIPLVMRLSASRRYERPAADEARDGFVPTNRVTVLVATTAASPA